MRQNAVTLVKSISAKLTESALSDLDHHAGALSGVTLRIICRDFRITCRSAYMPSGSTNDEAFPRRFHHLPRHLSQGVDLDEAGNLRQQTMQ